MTHGTQYGYKVNKCRCDACRAWNTAAHKLYRHNRLAKGKERLVRGKWKALTDSPLESS